MPDEHGILTYEEKVELRRRWKPEWVEDVVRILKEDPEWGAKKIVELPWYTGENGFERWPEEEEENKHPLFGRPILDLRGCPFADNIELKNVIFPFSRFDGASLGWVDLSGANLRGANFSKAKLYGAVFSRADLREAIFSVTDLFKAAFSEAELCGATFSRADLREATFSMTDLRGVTFSVTDIRVANLIKAQLNDATFTNCKLYGIDLRSSEGYAECDTDTYFGREIGKNNRRTPWLFSKQILREQGFEPKYAINVCSEIRLCFRDNGLFHKAAIYYEQEEYWRTRVKLQGSLKDKVLGALRLLFFEWMIGYGERPQRVIAWSFGVLVICALIFCGCGFQYETSPGVFKSMKYSVFAPFSGEAWMNFLRCMRFSIENFTTLGFSKMQPAEGISHWVASLEGVVGVLFVALATVTWARKAIRD